MKYYVSYIFNNEYSVTVDSFDVNSDEHFVSFRRYLCYN